MVNNDVYRITVTTLLFSSGAEDKIEDLGHASSTLYREENLTPELLNVCKIHQNTFYIFLLKWW